MSRPPTQDRDELQPGESRAGSDPDDAGFDAHNAGPAAEDAGPGAANAESAGGFYSTRLARYGTWRMVVGLLLLSVLLANLAGLAISFAALGLDVENSELLSNPVTVLLLLFLQAAIFVSVVYYFMVRRRVTSWREMGVADYGPGSSILRGLGYGLLFLFVSGVVGVLQSLLGIEQTDPLPFDVDTQSLFGRAALLIGGVVLAPISEEIFFRGYIFRAMTARKGLILGIVYSSALFGAIHLIRDFPSDTAGLPGYFSVFLPIAVGSTLLALAYHRSRDLWTPIVAHAVNNAFAIGVLFAAGS